MIDKKFQDMSYGKENVQISCINSLEEEPPNPLEYCDYRVPTEYVNLNLDPEFLVCCDCQDDCQVTLIDVSFIFIL